ncbi:RagB/SusD family nutrient uptake outer membrane protein [Mariniflexile sp.]|uniref:RagB/SusD family nutrient uptake outer membrane protein n=1 Tax=Mariniflexile sp. TaxID=1979402 RepID=UPI0040474DE3
MKNHNIKFKFKIALLLLTVLAISTSCDSILDEQPESEIGSEDFWKTPGDAETGISGLYDGMQKTFKENLYLWGETRADNYRGGQGAGSSSRLEFVNNDLTSGNSALRWDDLYKMILRANLAIKYIPEIPGVDKNLLGEAHAIRAFAYFHAIRVWGSVPLFTEPIEGKNQELQRTRTAAATIMNEVIIPDMLAAEGYMEKFANEYRFSETSILCLQAEVYMYLQDYPKAKIALDKLVALNEFSLVTTVQGWQDLFLNDKGAAKGSNVYLKSGNELAFYGTDKVQKGTELILSINHDLLDNDRAGIFGIFFAGLPTYYISPVLDIKWRERFPVDSTAWVTKYPTFKPQLARKVIYTDTNGELQDSLATVYGDWRYFLSREDDINFEGLAIGEARLSKYNKTNYSPSLDDSDMVLYRYSDMLLLLAEAENRLLNTDKALGLVNDIRTARLLPTVTLAEFGATIDEREDYILVERQLELLGEGKRWWDLMRTGKTLEVMNPVLTLFPSAKALTPERILSPIYFEHLIENPLLEQTPGYTNQ